MTSPDVIVIGAGVLGLCTAAELAARGHAVTVLDPGGENASSVAAGMIAPAMESLIDGLSPGHAALLTRARDLWPAFAQRHELVVHREGAEWRGDDRDAALAVLAGLGFAAEERRDGVFTPDDWRIEPLTALRRLSDTAGVVRETATVARIEGEGGDWRVTSDDGRAWSAPAVVVATGAAGAVTGLPEAVARLVGLIQPIRGQLLPIACVPPSHVIRRPGAYAAPWAEGVLIGATMEAGRRDLAPDPAVAAEQMQAAEGLVGVTGVAMTPQVGIRGASPDGLPMAGPTEVEGLHLALAPRRNGWLLGPLVGRVVADGIEGATTLPDAAALDPLRFA